MKNPGITALLIGLICLVGCNNPTKKDADPGDKEQLLSLEKNWLKAEFSLDTAYLSSIIDSSFIDISEEGVHNKQQAILSMYNNISQRLKDSLFIDSFSLENTIVNIYDNTAVIHFIVHTYKRDKGLRSEKRTRFYDVWIKRGNDWKAVASQGSSIEN